MAVWAFEGLLPLGLNPVWWDALLARLKPSVEETKTKADPLRGWQKERQKQKQVPRFARNDRKKGNGKDNSKSNGNGNATARATAGAKREYGVGLRVG